MNPFSATLLALCALASAHAAEKPNVLFFIVDDLRPELGCYGRDYIRSPNIDALARSGVVFDRAYVQQAVCSPSRTCVLTGLRPDTTKVTDLVTHFRIAKPDTVTLQQTFKNHGYFVQGMGKIFHGKLNDEPSWSVPWQTPKSPAYALPENLAASPLKVAGEPDEGGGKKGPAYECADVPDNTYQDGKVADLAVATLGECAKKEQPFFLAVGFVKPHLPWVAPKKYWDLYDETKIDLAPNPFYPKGAPDYAIRKYDGEIYQYQGIPPKGEAFPPEVARKLKHAYYAGVSYTDAQVGKVMAELDRLGLRQNTIVILWGDHGWKLGEHASWGKHSNVENDTNAPLILSVPGLKTAGAHTKALVEFVDIYPTLGDLADLPLPANLEGTSFRPLLENLDRAWKTAAFSQYPRAEKGGVKLMGYSMRTDRYRFTVWEDQSEPGKVRSTELYDHATDPQENTNLSGDPANADLVATLMTQYRAGWRSASPAVAVPAN